MTSSWTGSPSSALNGGPEFTFSEAISFQVDCEDQAEVDYYWDALPGRRRGERVRLAEGQVRPVLADRPGSLPRLLGDPDPEQAQRVMQAMLQMRKIDVAELERAAAAA